MAKIRAFVAVDISQAARDALAEVSHRLQERGVSGVRWVRPEGVHLTLKFLGDIDPTLVDGILEALERACRGIGPLRLAISGVGAFPNLANPRVLWVGLKGELESLGELQGRIDREVSVAGGLPLEERPFSPHLTLGRLRDSVSREERRRAGEAATEVGVDGDVSWDVEDVNLIRSTLTPSGATYEVLGSRKL